MSQLCDLPINTIIKDGDTVHQIGGVYHNNGATIYVVSSMLWGDGKDEIIDSDKLLIWNGKERISRNEYRPDIEDTKERI